MALAGGHLHVNLEKYSGVSRAEFLFNTPEGRKDTPAGC